MKIIQICPYAMDRAGGVQRHVRDLSKWLTDQGHETRIIAPPSPGQTATQTEVRFEIGRSKLVGAHGTAFEISLANPLTVRRLAREMRHWGADLVHLHTPWTPFVAGQVHKALGLPTVTTIHATLPQADGADMIDRYIRRTARKFIAKSREIITPSVAPLDMLRDLIPNFTSTILPPCVDLSGFANAPRDPQDALTLLFLGRLEARKGLDVLFDAWPKIAEALPHAKLIIAGDGEQRARVQGAVQGRVSYVGRPDDAQARRLMASADFFMAPAPYGESYGLVLAEAMSAGAIPIAAANAGYASVLAKGGADLLVPPGDVTAFAERVITLAQNTAKQKELRDWAKTEARVSDVRNAGPQYLDLYRGVLTR